MVVAAASPFLRAGYLTSRDVESVVEVRHRDVEHEGCECRLVVVPRGVVPDRIGHPVLAVRDPRDRFGERERGTLRVGEERRLAPCWHRGDSLRRVVLL